MMPDSKGIPSFPSLEEALDSTLGSGATIRQSNRVAGGDINRAYRLTLRAGKRVFLKTNESVPAAFFQAEADGLAAIERTGAIRVPHVLALGTDAKRGAFLLMEWIEDTKRKSEYWEIFACQLAAMHRSDTSGLVPGGAYGWKRDNYIGVGAQVNTPKNSWISFFRDCRLAPQIQRGGHWFDAADRKRITRLLDHLDMHLLEPEHPSLLHGDLWSGNFITGSDGSAWLIDPAVYVGHAEADLAMTELFGGFPQRFYDVYREVSPLQPEYERRRDLYNLYHLLNHLNLFGGGYLSSVRHILKTYGER